MLMLHCTEQAIVLMKGFIPSSNRKGQFAQSLLASQQWLGCLMARMDVHQDWSALISSRFQVSRLFLLLWSASISLAFQLPPDCSSCLMHITSSWLLMISTGSSTRGGPHVCSFSFTHSCLFPLGISHLLHWQDSKFLFSLLFSYTSPMCTPVDSEHKYHIPIPQIQVSKFSPFLLYSFQSYSPPSPPMPDLWHISFPSVNLNNKYIYNIFHVKNETILCKIAAGNAFNHL